MDICVEVSMMSSHLELPWKGHLEQVLHMFGYLKKHQNNEIVFNPSENSVAHQDFKREDWSSNIYGYIKEELPPKMPEPRVLVLRMRVYVDSDHSGESVIRK